VVLPVPVCACPIMSLPSIPRRIVPSWIGVASSNPMRRTDFKVVSLRFNSENFTKFFNLLLSSSDLQMVYILDEFVTRSSLYEELSRRKSYSVVLSQRGCVNRKSSGF